MARVARGALVFGRQVLVVDDGSIDGTVAALARIDGLHLISHPSTLGKGAALRTGLRWALEHGHERAITLDADGQHDPADIPALDEAALDAPGALIIGERDMVRGAAPRRSRLGLALSNSWLRLLSGVGIPDSQSGFRSYPVREVLGLEIRSSGFDFEFEALLRCLLGGVPLRSVPVSVSYPRRGGPSSNFRPVRDTLLIFLRGAAARIAAKRPGTAGSRPPGGPEREGAGAPGRSLEF